MQQLAADGKVQLLGIIQEQHPDRCRLFAQWQNFDWPILHDPINQIPTRAVPLVIAIDEHGIVRSTRPQPDWVINTFLTTDYAAPDARTPPLAKPDLAQLEAAARASQSAAAWRAWAEACTIWGGADSLNDAIAAWDAVLRLKPESAPAHFARGVALRMRYESKHRHDDDFHAAVTAWGRALDLDPNHYIYRRRIQQYGPRLMKPYPFYDWIETARAEIRKRGEEPVSLGVEPGGAEIARPARSFTAGEPGAEPDAQGRIRRDESLVLVNSVVVPAVATPGETVRIHLELAVTKTAH